MTHFAKSFGCLVFSLCVVMAVPAWATDDDTLSAPERALRDSVPLPPIGELKKTETPLPKQKDPSCSQNRLTGEKFLDMFHAIAMHGDLTDVPFIEKTLETKFDVRYSDNEDKQHRHYKRAFYRSMTVAGVPLEVNINVDVERDPNLEIRSLGRMDFEGAIFNCLKIKKETFMGKFGRKEFLSGMPFHGYGPVRSEAKNLGKIGKNTTNIEVTFSYIYGFEGMPITRSQIWQSIEK